MPASQHQPRRAYQRYSPAVWNSHKGTVRELLQNQAKTYDEVAAVLKAEHGFDIGVRQLKRWAVKWGFFKHISDSEMRKMVRTREKRQEQLGRPTKFLRKLAAGEGDFQEVPQAKLDAYQKRFGAAPSASPMSQYSSLPSNVTCHTPTNCALTPHPGTPHPETPHPAFHHAAPPSAIGLARHCSEAMVIESSDSVSAVFSGTSYGASASPAQNAGNVKLAPPNPPYVVDFDMLSMTFAANTESLGDTYRDVVKMMKNGQMPPEPWLRAVRRLRISLFEAACYPGCPQSLTARFVDALSCAVVRERRAYSSRSSDIKNETALHRTLAALQIDIRFWGRVLIQQRLLQIWEPVLGPKHPKMVLVRENLGRQRRLCPVDVTRERVVVEWSKPEALSVELGRDPFLGAAADLMHVGGVHPDQLLEQLQMIESPSANGLQIRREMALLRYGRSEALIAVYYSFISRFDDAEKAFYLSERYLKHETCVEIRLHHKLWYAEHKTRVGDWEGVGRLMHEAHALFMADDKISEFAIQHFPGRFKTLCAAVSAQLPIDKVTDQTSDPLTPGQLAASSRPSTSVFPRSPRPGPAESSALAPSRLFPPSPNGANSVIDIEAWRQFVQYSPDEPAYM